MPDREQVLLQTKFNWPRPPKDVLTRTRLEMLLSHDIHRQLILVCAPAGFGKTTLVSTWLNQMTAGQDNKAATLPAAWISLDENDSDLNRFLHYFIAALRTIFNDACEVTLALLQAQQPPPEAFLLSTFINELEKLPGDIILVLDDYHSIQGTQVPNLLSELVSHWPGPLHMVLISRLSPSLPLSNMRARGILSEIRTRDLRFTPEETADYLSQTQFALMGQTALTLLENRFEGWSAGLHLAALSLRSAASQDAVLAALSSENANITDYLVDEVLSQQVPAIRSFLLKTSILDRFNAALCEAVVGEIDPAWNADTCLDWIERSELFLIALDDHQEWYRYHHLFQELLQRRLSAELAPEEVNKLHIQASIWFEEKALTDEALQHALAAGEIDLAARQMSTGLREVIDREDRPTLERWLRLLPEEIVQQRPGLLMVKAWEAQFAWRPEIQLQTLQRVADLMNSEIGNTLPVEDQQIIRGQVLLLQSQWLYFTNKTTEAMEFCRQALALLPPSWKFSSGGAMFYLGMSMHASGQALAAEQLLLDEYTSCSDKTNSYAQLLLHAQGWNYLKNGQLDRTRQIGKLMLHSGTSSRMGINKSWGAFFVSVADYQQNDLLSAEKSFTQLIENRYTSHLSAYRDAVAGLAFIHQIRGEGTKAWQIFETISQFDLERSGVEDARTCSLRARLMLMQRNLEGAGKWVDTLTEPPPDMALLWLEEPQITRARVLLARGTESDLPTAQKLLSILDEIVDRTYNTRFKIEVLALRALVLDAQGETIEGNAVLKQAIELARPGGFTRIFVDLGKPMQGMLQRLVAQGYSVDLAGRILAAFQEDEKDKGSHPGLVGPETPQSPIKSELIEPLTPRELEVLTLLRGSSSIKEIAQQLHISYTTVKRHTANIYGKLGVNQRWKAVVRAEELNLL